MKSENKGEERRKWKKLKGKEDKVREDKRRRKREQEKILRKGERKSLVRIMM